MTEHTIAQSNFWLNTHYGKELAISEVNQLSNYFKKIFGFNIIQVGNSNIDYLTNNCKINHQLVTTDTFAEIKQDNITTDKRSLLYCASDHIPLATNSIDAVVIPHGLEFSARPKAILREVDRILVADGHLIILGFNPYSLWGISSKLSLKKSYPWRGKWISCKRVCDWLEVLNYDIYSKDYIYFKPHINNQKILNSMRLFEVIGKMLPLGSAVYCINARKKQESLIPLHLTWKDNVLLEPNGAPEPLMKIYNLSENEYG